MLVPLRTTPVLLVTAALLLSACSGGGERDRSGRWIYAPPEGANGFCHQYQRAP